MTLALALHVCGLLLWAAGLVYLPVLIRAEARAPARMASPPPGYRSLSRWCFVMLVTPAALWAIAAGTAVFLLDRNVDVWLSLKLALVSLLVAGHCLLGAVVIGLEAGHRRRAAQQALALLVGCGVLMLLITALVLAKPELG